MSFLFRDKTAMPDPAGAPRPRHPPLRRARHPLRARHAARAALPRGRRDGDLRHGLLLGPEREFWQVPGVYTTAVGYAGGFTPNPTYEEVCSGRTGHNEVVFVAYRPEEISYELLRLFWEGHDPTQGMRQGNDMGTQYRSAIYTTSDAQREAAEASRSATRSAWRGRLRRDHDRDRRRPRVLLRRGLPPAVPRQEPRRLLRHGRDRSAVQ